MACQSDAATLKKAVENTKATKLQSNVQLSAKKLDWGNLRFEYKSTNAMVQCEYKDGKWGEPELKYGEPVFPIHIAANVLHYGQAIFEGVKAFPTPDGKGVSIFRPLENAKRFNLSAKRLLMPEIDERKFVEAMDVCVKANADFVPAPGTGASLYLRPVMFGDGPMLGLAVSPTYKMCVFCAPVGPYYSAGLKPVRARLMQEYDRAAPKGTGRAKMAGNYAASFAPAKHAKDLGYVLPLFGDPATRTYIDEFSTSNFMGITKDGHYKTPKSETALLSITNKSLQQLALDLGMKVSVEPLRIDELSQFDEIGAVGTAAIVTPVYEICIHDDKPHLFFGSKEEPGKHTFKLYKRLQDVQYGLYEDTHNWMHNVPLEDNQIPKQISQ